ncbi:hypothetical protein ACFL6X_04185 [Candidatus Latescibacterota bacterium]
MRYEWILRTVCLAAMVMGSAQPGVTQEPATRLFRDISLGSGAHYQYWSGDGDLSVQEVSVPVTIVLPVTRRLSLDAVSGTGFATLDRGASSSLNGLTDTKVRASLILGDELALITVGANTPTGKTGLSEEEREISRVLSQNALRFRTPNFGQGLDINAGLATARKIGDNVIGLGFGYLLKGEFEPADGGPKYTPSPEMSLTAGIDRKLFGGDGKLTLDAVYTVYGEDEREGTTAFESGNKLLLQVLGQRRGKRLEWRIYALGRMKEDSRSHARTGTVDLSNGAQYEGGLSLLTRGSGRLNLRAMAQVRQYEAGDTFGSGGAVVQAGEATIFSAGPGLRLRLSTKSFLDLNLQGARGKIDGDSVTGIDISGGLWIRL